MTSLTRGGTNGVPVPLPLRSRQAVLMGTANGGGAALLHLFDGLRPGEHRHNGNGSVAPVITRAEVDRLAADPGALAARLAVAAPLGAARAAAEQLRAAAAGLLGVGAGRGDLPELIEQLARLDARIAARRAADAALLAEIAAAAAEADAIAALEGERATLVRQRVQWDALIDLLPRWRTLVAARGELRELDDGAGVPADAGTRLEAIESRRAAAARAGRDLEQRAARVRRDLEAIDVDPTLVGLAAEVGRLRATLPDYRARLLELAATRARLAELERSLADDLGRLGSGWDLPRVAATTVDAAGAAAVREWQERAGATRRAHDAAERRLASARALLARAADAARRGLTGDDGAADERDARWRDLWQLRTALEEIWQVQSRAEAKARSLAEHEERLRRTDAGRSWLLAPARERLLGRAAAVAAVLALWAGMTHDPRAVPAVIAAALLGGARLLAHVRRRWVGFQAERRRTTAERLARTVAALRRGRDGDWARAARLADTIRDTAARLGLTEPATIEMVEAHEQELAASLRGGGAASPLTACLLALLDAQAEEQEAAAEAAAARAASDALTREWEAWRAATGLPADLAAERAGEWLDGLHRTSALAAGLDDARLRLQRIEPDIAAWEEAVRAALRGAGRATAADLCGSDLAAALMAVEARVGRAGELGAEQSRCAAERDAIEGRRAVAAADRAQAEAELGELLAAAAAADVESLRRRIEDRQRWDAARARVDGLEREIHALLAAVGDAGALRALLAQAEPERWRAEADRLAASVAELDARLAAASGRRRFDDRLGAAGGDAALAELRGERAALAAEIGALARTWQVGVLAAALLDLARREREAAERRECLGAASAVLAALTGGERARLVVEAGVLATVDRAGAQTRFERLPAAQQRCVVVSVLVASRDRAAAAAAPVLLDDALGGLPDTDLGALARGLGVLGRSRPLVYLTAQPQLAELLARQPGATRVPALDGA